MTRRLRSSLPLALAASLCLVDACGGDRSASPEARRNPTPTLTSADPAKLYLGPGPVPMTLHGSGFMRESRVEWNGVSHPFGWVDSTTITLGLSTSDLAVIPTSTVSVTNPAPGGGTSAVLTLPMAYPVPVLTSISPTSGEAGSFQLTRAGVAIFGSGLFAESKVYWDNGTELTRTSLGVLGMGVIIPPDLAVAGTHTIWAKNPPPEGGESNRLVLQIYNPLPEIRGVLPNPVATQWPTSLLVAGTGFTSSSIVRWNGSDRATQVFGDTLVADIPASDLAAPGSVSITVYNPPPVGGTSAPVALTIAPTPLSLVATLPVENVAVVHDATRGVLYASVPATDAARANTVVKIDPASGSIVASLAVSGDPGPMDISDDDRFLYVALRGQPKVVRIDLATFTQDIAFDPGTAFGITTGFADQLVALPGSPRTVAVFVRNAGAVLFDDGVARINASAARGLGRGPSLVRGPDGSHVYGYDLGTGFDLIANRVTPDGFQVDSIVTGLVAGSGVSLVYGGGLLYASSGVIVDPVALVRAGVFLSVPPFWAAVAPDAPNDRIHFLSSQGIISTYDATSRAALQQFGNASIANLRVLTRWGTDGLAIGGGAKLVIVRGSLVAP